jgi:hypothetical protein
MNYKEHLYKNALKIIEFIYTDSKYNPNVDLYRSFDIINSVNDAQLNSKEWLVEKLLPFLSDYKLRDIIIMGSWYGITGMLLKNHLDENIQIHNVDTDPSCEFYSHMLMGGNKQYEKNWPITDDAVNYFIDKKHVFQLIINTSCEHMDPDDIRLILNSKPIDTLVCFQSNNYHADPEHINTHDSLDSFVESLDLVRVYYKGEMKPSEDYTRYMVIGI